MSATTAPAAKAARAKLRELHPQSKLTTAEVAQVAAAAVDAAPATQVRRPWRSTIRTAFQWIAGVAPMLPAIVHASGIDESLPAVGGAISISIGITRVMAMPQVEQFLQRFVPWLAASPAPPRPT